MAAIAFPCSPIEHTYNDIDNLLHYITWKFIGRFGGDYEEWRAAANLIFVRVYRTYRPEDGPFQKRVGFVVWREMINYWLDLNGEGGYKGRLLWSRTERLTQVERTPAEHHPHRWVDTWLSFSDDARTVARLVLDETPYDVQRNMRRMGTKAAIRRYLLDLGWSKKRVTETIQEIRQALA